MEAEDILNRLVLGGNQEAAAVLSEEAAQTTAADAEEASETTGYGLRSRTRGERLHFHPTEQIPISKREYDDLLKGVVLNTMSLSKVVQMHPEEAAKSIKAELQQFVDKKMLICPNQAC